MSDYKTILGDRAQNHLGNLFEFYQKKGLGTNFLSSFYDLLEELEAHPGRFPFAKTKALAIRKAIVQIGKRSPQAIVLYRINNQTVYILGTHVTHFFERRNERLA